MRIVETGSGRVRGTTSGGVAAFTGIPYAVPPLGARRFRPPQSVEPWTGIRDALDFGPLAMQGAFEDEAVGAAFQPQDEDCLLLNTWSPATDGARRPVIVYLHGGGFQYGGARADGATLAREGDVVVVSIAHRLGTLGYLYLGGLDEDAADTANVGLLDIVEGLRWVRDNIEAFGGDPSRVTLWGESGGGWKISTLLAMPAAAGLFHGAIIQSGSYSHALTLEQADDHARRMLAELGIAPHRLDRLAEIPVERFARPDWPADQPGRLLADGTWQWNFSNAPVVDGKVLPREPFAPDSPGITSDVPLLIGVTRDEFGRDIEEVIFSEESDPIEKAIRAGLDREGAAHAIDFYRSERPAPRGGSVFAEFISDRLFAYPAVLQAERRIALGGAPVYEYLCSWPWPHEEGRAIHSGDMMFVFGNLTPDVYPDLTPEAEYLARTMRMTWAAFAHNAGDPNHAGIPTWDPYDIERRSTLVFDSEVRLESDPRGERRRLVESEDRTR